MKRTWMIAAGAALGAAAITGGVVKAVAPFQYFSSIVLDPSETGAQPYDNNIAFEHPGEVQFRDGGAIRSSTDLVLLAEGQFFVNLDDDYPFYASTTQTAINSPGPLYMTGEDNVHVSSTTGNVHMTTTADVFMHLSEGEELNLGFDAPATFMTGQEVLVGANNADPLNAWILGDVTSLEQEGEGEDNPVDDQIAANRAQLISLTGDVMVGTVKTDDDELAPNSAVICNQDGDVIIQLGS